MRIPARKFRDIISEMTTIAARREELVSSALDALECQYPSLAQVLLENAGNRKRAAHWICAPQRASGGKSPCGLLADGDEDSVWDLLEGTGQAEATGHQTRSHLAY